MGNKINFNFKLSDKLRNIFLFFGINISVLVNIQEIAQLFVIKPYFKPTQVNRFSKLRCLS